MLQNQKALVSSASLEIGAATARALAAAGAAVVVNYFTDAEGADFMIMMWSSQGVCIGAR